MFRLHWNKLPTVSITVLVTSTLLSWSTLTRADVVTD